MQTVDWILFFIIISNEPPKSFLEPSHPTGEGEGELY